MNFPLVISFFTPDSIYEKEVQDLAASCEKLNLPYQIQEISCAGKWVRNLYQKPKFILEKLKELKQPLLWIDADGIIVKRPLLFQTLKCDFAVRIDPEVDENHQWKVNTATMFVRYTENAIDLLERWVNRCEKGSEDLLDQEHLRDVLFQESSRANTESLPIGYCRIVDLETDKIPQEDTYILQFQASRLGQKLLDGEVFPFFNYKDLTGQEIKKLHAKF